MQKTKPNPIASRRKNAENAARATARRKGNSQAKTSKAVAAVQKALSEGNLERAFLLIRPIVLTFGENPLSIAVRAIVDELIVADTRSVSEQRALSNRAAA